MHSVVRADGRDLAPVIDRSRAEKGQPPPFSMLQLRGGKHQPQKFNQSGAPLKKR